MNDDPDRLKVVLESKVKKISNDIRHELHNKAYNDSLQNEIRKLEWVLEYTTQKKVHIDKLQVIVQDTIAELKIGWVKSYTEKIQTFYLRRSKLSDGFCILFIVLTRDR
jgi:hypothetical protein